MLSELPRLDTIFGPVYCGENRSAAWRRGLGPSIAILALIFLSSCGRGATPTAEKEGAGAVYSTLPSTLEATDRYLFYLHGRIIEIQGLPAVSPEHGEYQYTAILEKLASFGLVVISEARSRDVEVNAYAARVVDQIETLLDAGVPPEHITVVGASKGAYIAGLVSHLARKPRLRFVLLAGCSAGTVAHMRDQRIDLFGEVLAIRDVADTELAGSCEEIFAFSQRVGRHQEIVLEVGSGHGILYQPLDEWVIPTVEWTQRPPG